MKVYVISMLNSPRRRKSIQKQLDRLNVDFQFIDAVDGKQLTSGQIASLCDLNQIDKYPEWLNRGAIGCALSHLKVYEDVVDNDLPNAIVLEDDMIIPYDFSRILKDMQNITDENAVILLYYRAFREIKLSTSLLLNEFDHYKRFRPATVDHIPMTTGAYFITGEACKSMIQVARPIKVTADSWAWFYKWKGVGKVDVLFPRPMKDGSFKSDIDYFESKPSILGKALALIDRFQIPVAYSILRYRRRRLENKMSNIILTPELPNW